MRDYRSDISRAEFETRSITDKLIITIILKVIDKHGVDKFFVGQKNDGFEKTLNSYI